MKLIQKTTNVSRTWRRPGPIRKRAGIATRPESEWTPAEARAYRSRLESWTGSLNPRNEVEHYLVERAVSLSWQIDRADRAGMPKAAADAPREDAGPPAGELNEDRPSERSLKYQLACGRTLLRTLDALTRMRDAGKPDHAPAAFREPQPATGPRRRVGGYPVPVDPAPTVSCADRIPVRLRRARAAAAAAAAG